VKVRVRSFATLREIKDRETVVALEGDATVGLQLDELLCRYPGLGEALFSSPGSLHDGVNVLKNGRNTYFLQGLETPLTDGDTPALFPPRRRRVAPGK
jgi:molybdopterin synthase sulfur carrier subunit